MPGYICFTTSLLRAVSLRKTSILLVYELSSPFLFSLPCVRSRELLQSFLIILGPGGFLHQRIAMKHPMVQCVASIEASLAVT